MMFNERQIAAMIDHTALKADTKQEQIVSLCREAVKYGFAAVCVNPYWVSLAAGQLAGSGVKVATVVGFPLGATSTFAKVAETNEAIASGADEIDMVLNIGALKSGDLETVEADIKSVVEACRGRALVKVILETGMLAEEEKRTACTICKTAGADFVKTSTGFGPGGATVEDISLMRQTVGPDVGVKASGGVKDFETACRMVEAGATRIGTSSGVAIVSGGKGGGY